MGIIIKCDVCNGVLCSCVNKYSEYKVHTYKLTPSMIGEMLINNEEVRVLIHNQLEKEFNTLSKGTVSVNKSFWQDGKLVVEFV